MNKKFEPFLVHSELTDCIYIIDKDDKYEVTEQCIKAMKATNRMPKWIPVSERLPEDKSYVLVTIKVHKRQPHVRSSWYQEGFFHNDNGDSWRATDKEVVGWMYSPQPYKVESED